MIEAARTFVFWAALASGAPAAVGFVSSESPEEKAEALVLESSAALRRGEAARAIALAREALALSPRNALAGLGLGEALESADRPLESFAAFDRAILWAPGPLFAARVAGIADARARERVETATAKLAAARPAEGAAELLAGRARAHLALEEGAQAEADAAEAVRREPRSPHGHFARALVLLEKGDREAAEASFGRARELCSGDSPLPAEIAAIRAERDGEDAAARGRRLAIARALARGPSEDAARRLEGEWSSLADAAALAAESREKAAREEKLAKDEAAAAAWLEEAKALFERRDHAGTVAKCDAVLAIRSDSVPAALLLAKSLAELGEYERATAVLGRLGSGERGADGDALRLVCATAAARSLLDAANAEWEGSIPDVTPLSPAESVAVLDLLETGHELDLGGDAELALRCFYEAARLAPGRPDPYESMASTLSESGRFEEALIAAEKWRRRLDHNDLPADDALEMQARIVARRYSSLAAADALVKERPGDPSSWEKRCIARMSGSDLTEALAAAEKLIAIAPEDSRGYALRAELFERAGAPPARVLEDCERAAKLSPFDARAGAVARRLRSRLGETERVVSDLTLAIAAAPEAESSRTLYLERADILMTRGEHAKAAADYAKAIEVRPFRPQRAQRGRREAWIRLGDTRSVLDDTARALAESPDDRATLRERGRAFALAGDKKGAAAVAARLAALESSVTRVSGASRADLFYEAGIAAEAHGDLESAVLQYRSALVAEPLHSAARLRLGVAHLRLGEPSKAAEALAGEDIHELRQNELLRRVQLEGYSPNATEIMIYRNPPKAADFRFEERKHGRMEAILALAETTHRVGLPWTKAGILTEFLDETPDDFALRRARAKELMSFLIDEESAREAAVDVAKCIEIDPDNPLYRTFMARIRQELGDFDGAIESFDAALRSSPDDPRTLAARGWLLYFAGHAREDEALLDRALADANRSCAIRPNEDAFRLKAYIHDERGEVDLALLAVEEFRRVSPFASIPNVKRSFLAREEARERLRLAQIEAARAEAERAARAERESAEAAARLAAEREQDPYAQFTTEFGWLLRGAETSGRYRGLWDDGTWEANWRSSGRLQQKLDAESRFNDRCRELERRFGVSAAERERAYRPR